MPKIPGLHGTKPNILTPKRGKDVDMTTGNITRHIISFALPLLVGNIFQQLYNMVDTWVVGKFVSNEAYAAVGTVGPIVNMLIGFFMGLSSGAGTSYTDLMVIDGMELTHEEFAVGLRKGSDFTELLNNTLAELVADGTVAEISAKYPTVAVTL